MGEAGKSKRRYRRVARRLSALICVGGEYANGHVKNLSKMGLFVRSSMAPPPGVAVSIRFETITGQKIEVSGTVRWNNGGLVTDPAARGFGVRLDEPSNEYLAFFAALAAD